MKIIHLARDLNVEAEALLFLAQSNGIEAQTIMKDLTVDEAELVINAFENQENAEPVVPRNEEEKSEKESSSEEISKKVEVVPTQTASIVDMKEEIKPSKKEKSASGLFSIFRKNKKEDKAKKITTRKKFNLYQNKKVSPKTVIWLVRGLLMSLLALTIIFSVLVLSGYKPVHEIKTVDMAEKSKYESSVDFKAKLFLDNFVKTYFEYPENKESQKGYATKISNFYGSEYQGDLAKRKASRFVSSTLLSLDKEKANYLVTYETGSKKSKNLQKKTVQTTVYFEKKDNGYVIVGEPFIQNEQSIYGKQNVKREFLASDQLPTEDKKNLDRFVQGLFTAYTTNQSALENISSGLTYNSAEKFSKVTYSYYQKQDNGTYKAYVQAIFKSEMGEYKQEFAFNIKQNDNTYFATDFKYNIPANYAD